MSKYAIGDVVATKNHPTMRFIVVKFMLSPVRKEPTYLIRFENQPDDVRGFLIWEDDLFPISGG